MEQHEWIWTDSRSHSSLYSRNAKNASRHMRMARGQYGSLRLHRNGLAPSTFRRSPGAPAGLHSIIAGEKNAVGSREGPKNYAPSPAENRWPAPGCDSSLAGDLTRGVKPPECSSLTSTRRDDGLPQEQSREDREEERRCEHSNEDTAFGFWRPQRVPIAVLLGCVARMPRTTGAAFIARNLWLARQSVQDIVTTLISRLVAIRAMLAAVKPAATAGSSSARRFSAGN